MRPPRLAPAKSRLGFRTHMFSLMRSIGLVLLIFTFTVVEGCGQSRVPNAPTHRSDYSVLRRGIGGEPASLDPGQAADTFSFEVIRDLYEGLTSELPDGTVVPGVASSWKIDQTGTRYTFQLRPDARWSNGAKVRAMDFVQAWRRVVDPQRASPVADTLRPIAGAAEIIAGRLPVNSLGVRATQQDLLVVDLERPAAYFPQLLTHSATFPIFSEESAKTHSSHVWISNGPYVLSKWIPGEKLQLEKNQQYWGTNTVRIPYVEYISIPDEAAEFRQYRAGQLDVTQSVPTAALDEVRKAYTSELLVAPFLATAYYALNLRSPYLHSDLNLRKALAMAIDRKSLESTILPFGQTPAFGFVPPGTWNYTPQSWSWHSMDDSTRIEEARRLYKQAGFSDNKPLHLRVLFNSNSLIKQVAIAVASMWKEHLGVDSELMDEEYRVFLDSRHDRSKWDVARLGWTADYNDAANFLDTLRSRSQNNDPKYDSADYDELLDRAAASIDNKTRRGFLERAESLMLSDYPVIPIYFFSAKRLIKPYVKGAAANPLNRLYSKQLAIDSH